MAMGHLLAIDVGGTKIAAGVVDTNGSLLLREQRPTPAGDPHALWRTMTELISLVRDRSTAELVACGVGCGGPMTMGGETVSPLNIAAWRGFPLRSRLGELTGLPTWIDNDAKALALGEGWVGAATGVSNYVAMVVSTGVGGGIVLDGRVLDGASGNAGHIGHLNVVPDGRPCACGARGCLEAEASGTAIAATTGRPPVLASQAVRERTGQLVGRAIGSLASVLDFDLAVIAGSVALGFGDVFFASAQAAAERHAQIDFARAIKVRPAGLGDAGPLVGAAAVARRAMQGSGAQP